MSTTSDVTPAEHELPDIISVDDHVLEPKDLSQRELPASLRDRGPKVERQAHPPRVHRRSLRVRP